MKEDLSVLLEQDESPILEFKRQWYWNDQTPPSQMSDQWGELIKDMISLANGYIDHVGHHRHLVIGFSDSDKTTHDVNFHAIKQLSNLHEFKKNLRQKLERYTSPSFIDFNIELIQLNNKHLLVFEIPSPTLLIELKKELKTKTRHLDLGAVLVRKGQNADEVRTATPKEYESLKAEFAVYRDSALYERMNPEEAPSNTHIEKSIEKTVQLYMDQNRNFTLAPGYPVKVDDPKSGVHYEVYRLTSELYGKKDFIFLPEKLTQQHTLGELKKNKSVVDLSSAVVLIEKPKTVSPEKRKGNISKTFNNSHVYFIDEFGYEHLYKDRILPYEKYNLPVYVDGLYDEGTETDLFAMKRLQEWYRTENQPLFVVSGHGGIGKTTLAKQFLDQISDIQDSPGLLYIDSNEIVGELCKNHDVSKKINDMYAFYEGQMDADGVKAARFDKELFKLSIDNGGLVVVLDGLDEVIAKLGDRFDLETFVTSIFQEYSTGLHKTKVLITCRDYFWNEVSERVHLPSITLKAFNKTLAEDFFSQKLGGDKKKIMKAMEMAEQLAIEPEVLTPHNEDIHRCESPSFEHGSLDGRLQQGRTTYIPFLLDMIGILVLGGCDFKVEKYFESRYLCPRDNTDVLVAQVCRREIKKLNGMGLDEQIRLFTTMAESRANGISIYDIKEILRSIKADLDESVIEPLKAHPLLVTSGYSLIFRYDVFDTYFKSILVVDLLQRQNIERFNANIARIMSGYLKYDSAFLGSISPKIELNDDLILFCIELIEKSDDNNDVRRPLLVSAIVVLLLKLLEVSKTVQSNIHTRTEIIEKVFGGQSHLEGFCLVDTFGNATTKPTFDFRGKTLRKCVFSNYEYFFDCKMDDLTQFQECLFKNIDPRSGVNFTIREEMFDKSCDLSHIQHLLQIKIHEEIDARDNVLSELVRVFKLFYQRGNFYPRKQEEVRKKLFALSLMPLLLDKKVIRNYKDPKKPNMSQYRVDERYKSVISFMEQGTPSIELESLVEELI